MRIRHLAICIILCSVILTTGLGCKGLSKEEKRAIRTVRLQYWTVFGNTEQLNARAAEYMRRHPFVKIDIRKVQYSEFEDRFINALADDVGPDIISVNIRELKKYAPRLSEMPPATRVATTYIKGQYAQERVVNFQTNLLPSKNFIRGNYVSAVANGIITNNTIYGLPLSVDTMALFYNKDLLDQAGIPLPPNTWTEFAEQSTQATRQNTAGDIVQAGSTMGAGEGVENAPDMLMLLLMQNGITPIRGNRVQFTENMREAKADHPTFLTLRFYTDFANDTKEVYSWNTELGGAFDAFTSNRAVFYPGFSYELATIKARAPQMNLGVTQMPQLTPERPINVASFFIESVVKKSPNQIYAWDFVRFLNSNKNLLAYNTASNTISPLRAHIQTQKENPLLEPFISQILYAKNWYTGTNISATQTALRDLIDTFPEPAATPSLKVKQDQTLIINTAKKIQQTL